MIPDDRNELGRSVWFYSKKRTQHRARPRREGVCYEREAPNFKRRLLEANPSYAWHTRPTGSVELWAEYSDGEKWEEKRRLEVVA